MLAVLGPVQRPPGSITIRAVPPSRPAGRSGTAAAAAAPVVRRRSRAAPPRTTSDGGCSPGSTGRAADAKTEPIDLVRKLLDAHSAPHAVVPDLVGDELRDLRGPLRALGHRITVAVPIALCRYGAAYSVFVIASDDAPRSCNVRSQTCPLTLDEIRALPAVVDLVTAARIVGVGRTKAHEMVRAGTWPTRVLRLGKAYRVPTAELIALLSPSGTCGQGDTGGGSPPGRVAPPPSPPASSPQPRTEADHEQDRAQSTWKRRRPQRARSPHRFRQGRRRQLNLHRHPAARSAAAG